MSFDTLPWQPKRIAIIGGGISGLAAAYLLGSRHEISLFESEPLLGGHARTVNAGRNGDQPVDTGFIVFNYVNYPHLTAMFRDLDVPVVQSDMTFGASIDRGRIEYGLRDLISLIGQKRNLLRPGFMRMVRDILHFNARAEALVEAENLSTGAMINRLGLGRWFEKYYLLPICGAIWSTPPEGILDFPARSLVRFFRNHALLSATGQHQWWTVNGGSVEYVSRLERRLETDGVHLHRATPIRGVTRDGVGATLHLQSGKTETFDHVIFACHSDDALRLLARATPSEQAALGALKYQDNLMVLHSDASQMPSRRACWSSWVFKAESGQVNPAISVTYWMNRLQNIPDDDPLFVSLNPTREIVQDRIHDTKMFRHPVFDEGAIAAQQRLTAIQGENNTWFAGAYTRHGFHEDGFASAVRIARQMQRELV